MQGIWKATPLGIRYHLFPNGKRTVCGVVYKHTRSAIAIGEPPEKEKCRNCQKVIRGEKERG
jgi:hypothetical protein